MARINYIREHRAFLTLAARENLDPAARALWTALFFAMNERQRDGEWPDGPVAIRNEELMLNASISAATLRRAREQLREAGLIDFDARKGNGHTPVYILRYLTAERITQAAGQSAQATAPQPDPRASQRQSQRQIDANSRTDSARPLSYSIPLLNNKYKQSVYGGGGIPQGGRPPATAAGTAYQHAVRIGFLPTPDTAERISRLVIAYGPEMVREGLNRCAVRQAANFLYLEGALRGARRDGGWGRSRPPARANPSLAYMQRTGRDNAPNMPDWLRAELEGEQHGHDTDPDLPDHREAAEAAG